MDRRKFMLVLVCGLSVLACLGCGDQTDSRLSEADVAYLKAQRYQAIYGTATATATSTATVTLTTSTTVTSVTTTTVY